MKTRIILPTKPMSTNSLWTGRRFPTEDYKAYRRRLALLLAVQKLDHMPGYVSAHYRFYLPIKSALFGLTDGDNLVKGVQDAIVKHGVIKDDRKIIRYVIDKIPCDQTGMVIDFETTEKPETVLWFEIANQIKQERGGENSA